MRVRTRFFSLLLRARHTDSVRLRSSVVFIWAMGGGLGLLGETGRLNALKTTVFEKSQLKFKTAANLTKPFNKCTHKPPPMSAYYTERFAIFALNSVMLSVTANRTSEDYYSGRRAMRVGRFSKVSNSAFRTDGKYRFPIVFARRTIESAGKK